MRVEGGGVSAGSSRVGKVVEGPMLWLYTSICKYTEMN